MCFFHFGSYMFFLIHFTVIIIIIIVIFISIFSKEVLLSWFGALRIKRKVSFSFQEIRKNVNSFLSFFITYFGSGFIAPSTLLPNVSTIRLSSVVSQTKISPLELPQPNIQAESSLKLPQNNFPHAGFLDVTKAGLWSVIFKVSQTLTVWSSDVVASIPGTLDDMLTLVTALECPLKWYR